jgi:hypothetical protein
MVTKVVPLAFDSMGVRSMATQVETEDEKILLDPGVTYTPVRYGLPPFPEEINRIIELTKKVEGRILATKVMFISHYHFDHFFHYEPEIYKDKILFVKNPVEKINKSQAKRAQEFLSTISKDTKVIYADASSYSFGNTHIEFSPPFPHGKENTRVGFVIIASIRTPNFKLVYAPDVEGPIVKETTDWIIEENPGLLILGGPPTYFLGWAPHAISAQDLKSVKDNLIKILERTRVNTIILDHHLLRDQNYKRKVEEVFGKAKEMAKTITTAAEFVGGDLQPLEAQRKEYWLEGQLKPLKKIPSEEYSGFFKGYRKMMEFLPLRFNKKRFAEGLWGKWKERASNSLEMLESKEINELLQIYQKCIECRKNEKDN